MTDKEFRRLKRSQLIDIIYQFQLKQDELISEIEKLSKELEDKRIRLSKTGNIAEAALELHNVMRVVQDAVEHYQEEMRLRSDEDYRRILQKAEAEAAVIIEKARKEADKIVAEAGEQKRGYPPV